MYDRPNAIKGRYVKIPNMLIFVAEPVNHEVIDPWRLFNIIYIMRTNGKDGGNWRYRCRHWSQTVIHWPRTSFRQCWHKSSFKRLLSPKIEPYPAK